MNSYSKPPRDAVEMRFMILNYLVLNGSTQKTKLAQASRLGYSPSYKRYIYRMHDEGLIDISRNNTNNIVISATDKGRRYWQIAQEQLEMMLSVRVKPC